LAGVDLRHPRALDAGEEAGGIARAIRRASLMPRPLDADARARDEAS
jgi:hypothetical protein